MKRRILYIISVIVILFVLVMCALPFVSFTKRKASSDIIRVGYHPNFGGSSAIAIALRNGFFKEEGINVELVRFASGPASMAALAANDIDVSFMGHGALGLVLQSDSKIFAIDSLSYAEEIIARNDSNINNLSDLYGKKIAVPFGTSGENFLRFIFDINNLDYKKINVINMDILGCVSALEKGYVDAVSVWAPITNEIYRKIGSDKLTSVASCIDYQEEAFFPMYWVVDSEFLENNRDTIVKFTRALQKSLDWRLSHLDETVHLVSNLLDKDIEDLIPDTKTAFWFSNSTISKCLETDLIEGWFLKQYEFLIKYGVVSSDINIDELVDLSILREILQEK